MGRKKENVYMSWFTQAAISKYHRLGVNNRNLFLTVVEARKSRIKTQSAVAPDETCFLACRRVLHGVLA